ncbi:MAG: hypothetical protein GY751_10750 [Bacteroidetes bacterium]|nr:hypothetical protein [Bacteroidota bacterium]
MAMKILQVEDCYFDTERVFLGNSKIAETEFQNVKPGVFFMHKDETFIKSPGVFCFSMKDYNMYKLNHDTKVNTINGISFI